VLKPATTEFFYANTYRLTSACKLCILKKQKQYREANRENIIQKAKKYREANREEVNRINREWRILNPERIRELKRKAASKQRTLNPEKYREMERKKASKRRALKLGNEHSPYSEAEVLVTYGTACHICGVPIDLDAPRRAGVDGWSDGLHIDHLQPLTKGGSDTLENVRPTHGVCNLSKGNKY
jgi:5-methylcytosine-specific restriction endonuclease McrA